MAKGPEKWEDEGRIFVKSVDALNGPLTEQRLEQRRADRVRRLGSQSLSAAPTPGGERSYIAPSDAPYLTQSLNVYLFELKPQSSNRGHGHQNEALFYILEGSGYDVHDGERYDWEKGDCLVIHTDCVHRHFNPTDTPAKILVVKAKPLWYFLGLTQEGRSYAPLEDTAGYGERLDWSDLWTPGVLAQKKVVKPSDAEWELTPFGRVKRLISERSDVRMTSVDVTEIEIPAGGHSGKAWKMADEALYVLEGSGYSLHWDVDVEIDERYYARVKDEPTRYEFTQDDVLYVPQNTVVQHFADDGTPLRLLSCEARVFKQLGYNNVKYLEAAPEYSGEAMFAEQPAR